jgi:hypothetical protein
MILRAPHCVATHSLTRRPCKLFYAREILYLSAIDLRLVGDRTKGARSKQLFSVST